MTAGIWKHVDATPDKAALRMDAESRSYAELGERARRLASTLAARGVGRDAPAAVMLPNGFEFFEVGVATTVLRARLLPLNWHLKGEEVAYILGDSSAPVLVAHESLREHVDAALAHAPECRALMVGGADSSFEAAPSPTGPTICSAGTSTLGTSRGPDWLPRSPSASQSDGWASTSSPSMTKTERSS